MCAYLMSQLSLWKFPLSNQEEPHLGELSVIITGLHDLLVVFS